MNVKPFINKIKYKLALWEQELSQEDKNKFQNEVDPATREDLMWLNFIEFFESEED